MKIELAYPSENETFPLILDPIPLPDENGKWWYLERPFRMIFLIDKIKKVIEVPVGFKTDFASIPRLAWIIVGHPCGEYKKAAVIHDFLYGEKIYPRLINDQIFFLGMAVLNMANWKKIIMHRAVNICGWYRYKENINRFVDLNINSCPTGGEK